MQDRGLPRHSAAGNIAAGIFLVACVAYFSACDNLGRTMEWPTYSVIYHANDGSGETYYSVTDHGSAHYVLDNMFGGRGLGFLGWAKSPNGEIEFGFGGGELEPYAAVGVPRLTGRAGDTLRLYAVWDGFVIVFNANGGLGQPPTMLIPSKDAPEYVRLPSISRFDHDLAGWNTCRYGSEEFFAADGEFLLDGERKNLRLYAIWTPAASGGNVYFTVFFNANGGEGPPIAPITGNAGYGITLPDGSGFSKYGYVFAGWSTMSCGSGALFPAGHEGVAFVGNVSLFAMWTAEGGNGDDSVPFTVEFNLHGGEGNIPPITGNAGYGITLPDGSELSRYGYTFAGWSTRPGGQGVIFPGGYEGAVFARDVTLYAVWVPVGRVFTLSFDPNGGSGFGPLPVTVNAGEPLILPNQRQLSMYGHIFEGWNTLADGSGNVHAVGEEFTPPGNLSLFAMWVPIGTVFTLSFDPNGGTGPAPTPITANAGYGITLPYGSGLSRHGYTFTGWSTRPGGQGVIFPGGYEGAVFARDLTLYAVWVPVGTVFTLTLDPNGAAGLGPSPLTANAGESLILPNQRQLSVYGHIFEGWNTLADGSGNAHSAGEEFTPTGNLTLYAVWVPVGRVFTLSFDPNGAAGLGPSPLTANAGESVILPNQRQLSMYGHIFEGWNTLADGSGNAHSAGEEFTPAGNLTLFAVWEVRTWIQISHEGIITAFHSTNAIERLEIPPVINNVPVSAIGEGAFAGYPMNSVVIPGGVVSIGDSAFEGNRLSSVVIPDSLAFIGSMAFADNRLSSVVIPDNIASGFARLEGSQLSSSIGSGAFAYNPLSSITIPGGVFIASGRCMGEHGEAFLAFYNATGRLAGTYLWIEAEGRWILEGGIGDAVLDIQFTGFAGGEAGIGFDQSLSILSPEALISVVGDFDGFRWIHDGAIVPGATGATLDFRVLHGNRMGLHFVSVEVRMGGRWYGSIINILVTM